MPVIEQPKNENEKDILAGTVQPLLVRLNDLRAKVNGIEKTGYNEHFKFTFIEHWKVKQEFRRLFAQHGIIFFVSQESVDQKEVTGVDKYGKPKTFTQTVVKLKIELLDAYDTSVSLSYNWLGECLAGDDKGIVKATVLGVKYWFIENFMIDSETEDPDGSGNHLGAGKTQQKGNNNQQQQRPEQKTEPFNAIQWAMRQIEKNKDNVPFIEGVIKKFEDQISKKYNISKDDFDKTLSFLHSCWETAKKKITGSDSTPPVEDAIKELNDRLAKGDDIDDIQVWWYSEKETHPDYAKGQKIIKTTIESIKAGNPYP